MKAIRLFSALLLLFGEAAPAAAAAKTTAALRRSSSARLIPPVLPTPPLSAVKASADVFVVAASVEMPRAGNVPEKASVRSELRLMAEKGETHDATAAPRAFDGSAPRTESATEAVWAAGRSAAGMGVSLAPTTAAAATQLGAASAAGGLSWAATVAPMLPLGYAFYELRRSRNDPKPAPAGFWRRAGEWLEAGLSLPVLGAAAALAGWVFSGTWYEPAATAAILALGAGALEHMLGQSRSVIVGGWQASHDMRMRVNPATGELRDVRGTFKRYGEDRYDKTEPGPVSPRERFAARTLAVVSGLPWFYNWNAPEMWIYAAAMTGVFALADAIRRRRKPFTPTAEDREHAARFVGRKP